MTDFIEEKNSNCPLCEREIIDIKFISNHHLIPRSRGGKETEAICIDCHRQIHALFTNKQLEKLNNVELLLADKRFVEFVIWIYNKPFGIISRAHRARNSKKRGRGG